MTSGRKAEELSVSKDEEIIKKNKIRVASVCFITDAGNCSGDKFSSNETPGGGSGNPGQNPEYKTPQEQCLDAGYGRSPCPAGSDPIPCPLDPSYFSCPCDSSFNKTCEKPYYGVGESCGGKYRQCEEDTARACQEENPDFTNHCPSGWQMGNETCSYDPTFGLCCNTCVGYNYTEETIPDGYILDKEPCINCSGEETFRIIPNPCDGFMDCGYLGPEPGAETCLSGTITKYDNCKPCPNLGNLSSCPTGYKCEYEKCSNKYYKVDGCQSGYDWDASSKTCTEHCDNKCKLSSCPANAYCDYEACSGKYCFDECYNGYEEDYSSQTCKECPANYKYQCSWAGEDRPEGSCDGYHYYCICEEGYEKNIDESEGVYCQLETVPCEVGTYYRTDGTCIRQRQPGSAPGKANRLPIAMVVESDGSEGMVMLLKGYPYAVSMFFSSNSGENLGEVMENAGIVFTSYETIGQDNSDACKNTEALRQVAQEHWSKGYLNIFEDLQDWYPEIYGENMEITKGKWCIPTGKQIETADAEGFFTFNGIVWSSTVWGENHRIGTYNTNRAEWNDFFFSSSASLYPVMKVQFK